MLGKNGNEWVIGLLNYGIIGVEMWESKDRVSSIVKTSEYLRELGDETECGGGG